MPQSPPLLCSAVSVLSQPVFVHEQFGKPRVSTAAERQRRYAVTDRLTVGMHAMSVFTLHSCCAKLSFPYY